MTDAYARTVAKVAVGQMADVVGYDQAHGNALEAVSDVMMRFIEELGLFAQNVAHMQGRTDVSAVDVVEGMQELGTSCADLHEYVTRELPDPFSHTIPSIPIHTAAVLPPSFQACGQKPPAHIPSHLPAFPDDHAVKFTGMYRKRGEEGRDEHAEMARKRRHAQKALLGLHEKLAAPKDSRARQNPFLVGAPVPEGPPLKLDVKGDGAPATLRAAFEPVLEAEAAAAQAAADVAGDGAADMDTEQIDAAPEPAAGPQGWQVATLADDAIIPTSESVFRSGRIGFVMDYASQLDRQAVAARYAFADKDAFQKPDAGAQGGGGRRRGGALDAERLKARRAKAILEMGPDAVLMDYPEGFVPRQGQ